MAPATVRMIAASVPARGSPMLHTDTGKPQPAASGHRPPVSAVVARPADHHDPARRVGRVVGPDHVRHPARRETPSARCPGRPRPSITRRSSSASGRRCSRTSSQRPRGRAGHGRRHRVDRVRGLALDQDPQHRLGPGVPQEHPAERTERSRPTWLARWTVPALEGRPGLHGDLRQLPRQRDERRERLGQDGRRPERGGQRSEPADEPVPGRGDRRTGRDPTPRRRESAGRDPSPPGGTGRRPACGRPGRPEAAARARRCSSR